MDRPRVIVSRCLELAECRYDGGGVASSVVRALRHHVDLVPVCPEVRIGLGVPRAPIQIEEAAGEQRLVQPSTGRDLTASMTRFAQAFADQTTDVDGVLLKSRSPSCGIGDVKIIVDGSPTAQDGIGMFSRVMAARFPHVAMEDEARLQDAGVLRPWLTRIWASARLRNAAEDGPEALTAFHGRYAPVRRVWPADIRGELDRLVAAAAASSGSGDSSELYRATFSKALVERELPEHLGSGSPGFEAFPADLLPTPTPIHE